MVKLLGDARGKFSVLSEGMSQAVSYLDTMILVLNLMEQSGGDLQQYLVSTANSIQQQVNNRQCELVQQNHHQTIPTKMRAAGASD